MENHLKEEYDVDEIHGYKGCADVITYQGFLRREKSFEKIQSGKGKQYIYVICDEAHFFTSDAMFNPHTRRILSSIVNTFKNAIRVYMSATPYECLRYIINEESKKFNNDNDRLLDNRIVFYHFNRNYSYLTFRIYSQIGELYNKIISSISRKKRWLIFIDNKSKCSTVKKEIEKMIYRDEKKLANDKKIFVVDADSKGDESYISLVKKEALSGDTYVLISTSVLDNGINLNNIDNIVISDTDIVKCLQMVGRARSKDDKSKNDKTVYVQRFDKKYIVDRICEYKECQDAYHNFDLAYPSENNSENSYEYKFLSRYYDGRDKDWKIAKRLFGRYIGEPSILYPNEIARDLVNSRVEMYRLILKEMEQEESQAKSDSNIHIGQGYLEYQLSWFGKEYRIDNDLTFQDKDKKKKALIAFLENHAKNNTIFETESQKNRRTEGGSQAEVDEKYDSQNEFKKEFTELYDSAFGRIDNNKDRIYDISKINRLLSTSNLPFEVISKSKLGWIVMEKNRDGKSGNGEK